MGNRLIISTLVLGALVVSGPLRAGHRADRADATVASAPAVVPAAAPSAQLATTAVASPSALTSFVAAAAAGASFSPSSPVRLMDTRPGASTGDGQAAGGGAVAAGASVELLVGGRGGVPVNAAAAVLNVTSTGGTGNGFLTVWPCGAARPLASSVNFAAGRDVANGVLTKLGTGGKVCVYAGAAATHLVIDVTGWFPAGSEFTAATPARLVDTRPGAGTVDQRYAGGGAVAAGTTVAFVVTERGGVPIDAGAVVLNVTAADAAGSGFLTVWPCGDPRPLASSVNFSAGRDAANSVLAKVGAGDQVCVYAGAAGTQLVVDVTGWFPGGTTTGGGVTGTPPPPVTTPLPPITNGVWQEVTPLSIRLGKNADDFGMQAMGTSASDRRVVYVGSSYEGIWRTTDAGTTWTKVNTGANGANLETTPRVNPGRRR